MQLVMDTLFRVYAGHKVPTMPPYAGFIKYTISLDTGAASEYWKTQLEDSQRASFPPILNTSKTGKSESRTMTTRITFPRSTKSSITKATILRTAWAMVLARYCNTDDVCFGTTVSGRHAPVSGLDRMAGPAVATVPVRIKLGKQQSVSNILQHVQEQASQMVAFEQFGLQNIARVSAAAKEACDFASLIVIQPVMHVSPKQVDDDAVLSPIDSTQYSSEEALQNYFSYPLVLQCMVYEEHVELHFVYDSQALDKFWLQSLSHQYNTVVQHLLRRLQHGSNKSSSRKRIKA